MILLDAVDLEINKKFDCIYSNKVLQHLTKDDFIKSLISQASHLNDDGLIIASLWHGEYNETFEEGLRFVYYNEKILNEILPNNLTIKEIAYYQEFEENDSLVIIIKKAQA